MRRLWSFGRNQRPITTPAVVPVSATDLDACSIVLVAGPDVQRVVASVAPSADTRRFEDLTALWMAVSSGRLDAPPHLIVLTQSASESPDLLAEAIAYFATKTPVVLLHRRDDLEDLGERYLRVVAAHPDQCDRDAPVEVVTEPATGQTLVTALRAVAPADLRIGDCPLALAGPLRPTPDPPAGDRIAAVAPVSIPATTAPIVVAVASAKGGAGKTTTAVALATTFARAGRRVCLVDLDVRDGQLATLLGRSTPNVATLRADAGGITDATVLAHLVDDSALGVHALLAPVHIEDELELLNGDVHRQILAVLRRRFDVIVLDCPVTYREPLVAGTAFRAADRIVVVTTLAVTSLSGMTTMLNGLTGSAPHGGLDVPTGKLAVVVNGALNGVGVDRARVTAHTAGAPVVAVVPHAARDVLIATNRRRLDLLAQHPDLGPVYSQLASWAAAVETPAPRVRAA